MTTGEGPSDTIYAPATAAGRAAIAIVRMSGPQSGPALAALAGKLPPPRVARHVRLHDPASGEELDDALALWLPGPASLTGEDVAELHLHGSRAVIAAVMAALGAQGLRLADPGEFTRRAFLNGKLDLTQAEAVADLAAAETQAQRRQALRQLDGRLGELYSRWAERLLRLLAHLEAVIDFPDEDLPPEIEAKIAAESAGLAAEITQHLADGHRGERLRDGIAVAIIGPPNAGKSSLLNQLARREAAITSPLAGTTRDVIEVAIDLAGYPVVFADTAGLRDSADVVEQEGLRRALARAEAAELRLFVFDARRPEDATGAAQWPGPDTLLVANKIDLLESPIKPSPAPRERGDRPHQRSVGEGAGIDAASRPLTPTLSPDGGEGATIARPLRVSALTGDGIPELMATLAAKIAESYDIAAPLLTRARHREALGTAAEALTRSLAAELPELRAEDLRLAWRSIGRITGRVDVEDLLDVIFRDFCLGK
ncbi:MAG TPA: tRNA uridine-5-carboxymethylaminomethyl(34) synthesis GTPase MnmE [Stellaceae bacterium]|nr:tRNA uridine-5-carboxymethylaminomethyl(34) synthesis GTPase MnmE [Stellaceae bacterium]